MKQEFRKRRYKRKKKCLFKMKNFMVADSCSNDARLDAVINTFAYSWFIRPNQKFN